MGTFTRIFRAMHRVEKRLFVAAGVIALISAIVLAALFIQRSTKVVPTRGGEYTEGVVGQPTYVNPVLAASEADRTLVHLLFANMNQVADKIESDNSGKTWKLRIKEGAVWSDAHKFTSDDIIFTIQKIQDPETKSPLFASWQGVSANRLSELEIQFNLVSAYPFFEEHLRNLFAIPKHLFADTPASNWKLSEYNLKPVSNGPYEFDNYQKQPNGFLSMYRLKVNPNFPGNAPLISNVSIKFFPRTDELMRSFNTGLVDGFGTFDPALLKQVNRPFALHSYDLPSYYAVFWNQSQNPALKDADVRRALEGVVDRRELISQALDGKANPVDLPISPKIYSTEEGLVGANIDGMNALLDEKGWKLGLDGIRTKTQNKVSTTLALTLTLPKIPFLETTARFLADRWSKIGAKVDIVELAPEDILSKAIKNREYQALLYGNVLNPPADLYSFWHTNERFYPGLNLSLYSSKEADKAIEAIRRESDPEKRAANLATIAQVFRTDRPALFLYSPQYLFVSSKDLRGVEDSFITEAADRFLIVSEWHLKTTRALK